MLWRREFQVMQGKIGNTCPCQFIETEITRSSKNKSTHIANNRPVSYHFEKRDKCLLKNIFGIVTPVIRQHLAAVTKNPRRVFTVQGAEGMFCTRPVVANLLQKFYVVIRLHGY